MSYKLATLSKGRTKNTAKKGKKDSLFLYIFICTKLTNASRAQRQQNEKAM